jgi:hypothetical protein
MRLVVLGTLAQLGALVCLVVGYTRRETVEGAYFSRAVGADAGPGAIALGDTAAMPWLVATGVLVLVGTALLVAAALRRGR